MMNFVLLLLATSTNGTKFKWKSEINSILGLFYGNKISNSLVGGGFSYDRRSFKSPTLTEDLSKLFIIF